jgi:hypothetical protein
MRCLPEPAAKPVGCEPRRGPAAATSIAASVRAMAALAMAALPWLGGPTAHASTFQWFTDQAAFTAALQPGSYTATGSVLSSGGGDLGTDPRTFSGGAEPYGFTVSATGGLYGIPANGGISALEPVTPLAFSAFTPLNQVRAFGGLLSLTDESEARIPGSISLSFFTGVAGTTLVSGTTTSIPASATFLGLITDDSTPITRVEFGTSEAGAYATAEEITLGVPVAVPEPSTLAGAGMAALALGIAYRRRRRARVGAVPERLP